MTWQARIAKALGATVSDAHPLQGGDLSQVFRADLADGRRVAVKLGALVGTEARMLTAMRATGATVPRVIWAGDDLLCLEWLDETRPSPDAWQALGETLARLHAVPGCHYGWDTDYAFGRVRIANAPCDNWPDFWADRRLRPFIPDLPAPLARRIEALAARLPEHLPQAPAPALLHGDLWTGNALFSGDSAYLIDPACYYGHGEVDLAMLELFGQPDAAFWTGYGACEPDRGTRRPIYQLWPALVHLSLFGAGYRGLVDRLLDQLGA
ncbi:MULTISPECIES: fructosamine kinase family protein [unclassified Mameliella]|uniref:fructosamine kinase family protein n=1 Tax=unclassified Mameliella TaxID=2630630 RepID=UPI00273F2744|nr:MULTISPECIES: fructosamine kinase family protein [unclassified Mameliella]